MCPPILQIDERIEFSIAMGVFYHEDHHETNQHHPRRCKYMVATLKELFSLCQTFGGRFSTSSLEEEYPMSDFEKELEVVVSAVISGVMEKQKQKPSALRHSSFSWAYSPATKELYFTQEMEQREKVAVDGEQDQEHNNMEEFYSVKSCFSCCSGSCGEAFYSVKTNLSRCSSPSLKEFDLSNLYWRRSVLEEFFCHCEGWPFGLCRRAVLLPPLPKSPSESWLSLKLRATTKKP